MPAKKTKPVLVVNEAGNYTYPILEGNDPKTATSRTVEAFDVAYGVIGLRKDGKRIILDHIASGYRIGDFPSLGVARQAIRELIQVTDFTWKAPPPAIKADCAAIIRRLQ